MEDLIWQRTLNSKKKSITEELKFDLIDQPL